jgi:hypothetical protein
MVEEPQVELTGWIRELAESHPFGPGDRRGTVNLIDPAARSRGAALIRSGEAISLARPLRGGDYNATPERPGFAHEITYHATPDGTGWGMDHLVLDPHGLMNTHIDALNHVAVNGTFYGGRAVDDPEQGSVDVLAPAGLLTRAVHLDIPALRGTAWAESPVTGADLDGARWVAEHAISILAWDMLDSREAKATRASAHVLTWAIGLLLVDNCDFAALRAALGRGTRTAGALILAPAVVEGANGVNLNPLVFR